MSSIVMFFHFCISLYYMFKYIKKKKKKKKITFGSICQISCQN